MKEFIIEQGTSQVILSAPHSHQHKRKGVKKNKDLNTKTIVKKIKELTDCHIIYLDQDINYDPNFDKNSEYKKTLMNYIEKNNIKYMIDIHGMKNNVKTNIDVGTNKLTTIKNDKEMLDSILKILSSGYGKVTLDKIFKSSKNTLSKSISDSLNIKTFQLEIGYSLRKEIATEKKNKKIMPLVNLVKTLEEKIGNRFFTTFDKILDVKSAYNYDRKISQVDFDNIGLEIEVAMNFNRDSYSFTKKLLENFKNVVGENGYFVKDGTVLGDYSFELILDPLPVDEICSIIEKLEEIISFSSGVLEVSKEKNCGIHANFNKYDVIDLNKSHQNILNIMIEKENYFETNRYKQKKFIFDYEEYLDYQEKIGDKYLFINYKKSKIIEIRNIKAELSAQKLKTILNDLLYAMYYDKISQQTIEKKQNISFDEIQSLLINNFSKISNNKVITIEIIDNKPTFDIKDI